MPDAIDDLFRRFGKAFNKADVEEIAACVTDDFEWRLAADSAWRNPYAPDVDEQVIVMCDHGCSSTHLRRRRVWTQIQARGASESPKVITPTMTAARRRLPARGNHVHRRSRWWQSGLLPRQGTHRVESRKQLRALGIRRRGRSPPPAVKALQARPSTSCR